MLSLSLHEFSHALMARSRGDKTAEREGRLTLNPLAHIDPIGFLAFLIVGFGWAKPVPYNPYNLKDPKWDAVRIALAGPGMNLALAVACSIAWYFVAPALGQQNMLSVFLFLMVFLNLTLMVFNVIPVAPLDGSKLLYALFDGPKYAAFRQFVAVRGPQILLLLVVVSLFTPLDPFFIVTAPANGLCSVLLHTSCNSMLNMVFGG